MRLIDWRDLYASNRAVIEQGGATGRFAVPASEGGGERTFQVGGRSRRALVPLPAGVTPGTAVPLVCMLHGCTQTAAGFASATGIHAAADRHGFAVVHPQQERG